MTTAMNPPPAATRAAISSLAFLLSCGLALCDALFGKITGPPSNPDGLGVDPLLVAPGTGGAGRDSLGGYQLKPGSPCIGAGALIEANGGRDFWGNPVSATERPDIGAHSTRGAR
jgi:hypothetical protein